MKRFLYIVGVILASLLLVCMMLVAALMSDKVETAAVQLATRELSRTIGTQARVGAVEYRFPARLAFRDVYLEDQQGDTLLYAGELYAHVRPRALRRNEIRFSHVRLSNVVADVHQLPDSTWNYRFLLDALSSDKDEKSEPLRSLISVRDVQLDSIRLRYEDYHVFLSHAEMDLHELSETTLDAEISKWAMTVTRSSLQPSSVQLFIVEDLKAHVIFTDTMLSVPTLRAQLPQSRMDLSGIEVTFPAGDTLYLSKSAHDIVFALQFNEAEVVPAEISLFVPRLQTLKRPLSLSGGLSGTLDSIAFDNLVLQYNNRKFLEGDIAAVGLPDLQNPYLRANLTDLHTNAARLQDFLSQLYNRPIHLPQAIHRLGDMHYRGLAEGRLHDLTLHGAFRTDLGAITTDGTLRSDSACEHMV